MSPPDTGNGPPGTTRFATRPLAEALTKEPGFIVPRAGQLAFDHVLIGTLPPHIGARITVDARTGCWVASGYCDRDGYPRIGGRSLSRTVYGLLAGPVPEGLELDHLCHTRDESCAGGKTCPHRRCVNPAGHLEPVTAIENFRRGRSPHAINGRKTHCDHGHEFTKANTYVHRGRRYCRACNRRNVAEYKDRQREQAEQLARAA